MCRFVQLWRQDRGTRCTPFPVPRTPSRGGQSLVPPALTCALGNGSTDRDRSQADRTALLKGAYGSCCTDLTDTLRLPLTRETHSTFCLDTAPPESCRASVLLNLRPPMPPLLDDPPNPVKPCPKLQSVVRQFCSGPAVTLFRFWGLCLLRPSSGGSRPSHHHPYGRICVSIGTRVSTRNAPGGGRNMP